MTDGNILGAFDRTNAREYETHLTTLPIDDFVREGDTIIYARLDKPRGAILNSSSEPFDIRPRV